MSEVFGEDREKAIRLLDPSDDDRYSGRLWAGRALHARQAEAIADAFLDAGWRPAGVPAVDREQLEEESFRHRPVLSMKDGHIAGCQCMDRVFVNGVEEWDSHLAGALLASGVLRSEADVKAEALEEAAREFAPDLTDPAPGRVRPVYLVRAWLRSRAAVLRGDGNA